jgi:hypothetical protein
VPTEEKALQLVSPSPTLEGTRVEMLPTEEASMLPSSPSAPKE